MEICEAGLADSTNRQYHYIFGSFKRFCEEKNHDNSYSAPVTLCIEYLTLLFKEDKSYSSINSARSALSQFVQLSDNVTMDFGKHPLTVKFMKGVFKLRPSLPRTDSVWDVQILLSALRDVDNSSASMKMLSYKCVSLLAIATGQRVQTLTALDITNINRCGDRLSISIEKVLKTTRPGHHISIDISRFQHEDALCPVLCLESYLDRTSSLRSCNQLFIGLNRPHKPVSSQTLSRWITASLRSSGIHNFTAHSTRAAATSKAISRTDIDTVLKSAGWSNSRTFAKHYHKPISDKSICSFTHAVFSS